MMRNRFALGLGHAALVALGAFSLSCKESSKPAPAEAASAEVAPAPAPTVSYAKLLSYFRPPPSLTDAGTPRVDTPAQVALGRMLFHEKRLSKNHDISCNSCHDLGTFGVDGKPTSEGHRGQRGTRNAPTVFHAAHHIAQFWDGRAATLEEQALGPMTNPVEMAMPDEKRIQRTLQSIPEYVTAFQQAFPGEKKPVNMGNAARAIAAFERKLLTISRFDSFLQGEEQALTVQERRGLELFASSGCTTCHNGPNLGGTSFQKLGVMEDYPTEDPGRFAVTQDEEDLGRFRVPTLRNVEKTAPYFHDGSVKELPTAVWLMAKHQLGTTFTDAQVDDVVAFLVSLTGELPGPELLAVPELPPSGPSTPKPDPT